MAGINSFALKSELFRKLQIRETVLMITAAILFQFIIHIIPSYNNVPIGAILLPMFYAPFIAVVYFRLHVGFLTAIIAPILNYFITGNPSPEILSLVTLELVLFVLSASLMLRSTVLQNFSAPFSIVAVKFLVFGLFIIFPVLNSFSTDFFLNSFLNAIPGLIVLGLINFFILRLKNKE